MPKTFFGKLFEAIGSIFTHVFNGAKKTFNQLSDEQKEALKHGSGVMALITQELGKTPAEIRYLILTQFPDLDVPKLEAGLFQIAHSFNLLPKENDLEDIIGKLQTYLESLNGNFWDGITQAAANILAVFMAPAGTKFAAVASLMEYVYQTFFKKK